jgi:hypothetical protein
MLLLATRIDEQESHNVFWIQFNEDSDGIDWAFALYILFINNR